LRRKPIQASEPVNGRFEPGIIQYFRLLWLTPRADRSRTLPFVSAPLPDALVELAAGQQPKPNGIVAQFKNELRQGRMRPAELFPSRTVPRAVFAELGQQSVA